MANYLVIRLDINGYATAAALNLLEVRLVTYSVVVLQPPGTTTCSEHERSV